jgi:hypothetical protein
VALKRDDTLQNRPGCKRRHIRQQERQIGSKRGRSQQSHISRPLKGNFQPTQKLKI